MIKKSALCKIKGHDFEYTGETPFNIHKMCKRCGVTKIISKMPKSKA